MAKKRFTDAKKWEDEWFYELEPRHKLAWLYLCDQADGATGTWKVQMRTLSRNVGTEISLEEFKEAFEEKLVWISDEIVWIPSFIVFQYKTLSAKNAAHRGMMRDIVRLTEGLPLTGKALELVQKFRETLQLPPNSQRPSTDPQQGSVEGHGNGHGNGNGFLNSQEEGSGEKGPAHVTTSELGSLTAEWQLTLDHHGIPKDAQVDDHTLYRALKQWGHKRVRAALAGFRAERTTPSYDPAANCSLDRLRRKDGTLNGKLENAGYKVLAVESGKTPPDDDGVEWPDE